MAGLADNKAYSTYVSDDGNSYSMLTLSWWAVLAASGGTATSANPLYGRQTRRRHPRKFVFYVAAQVGRFIVLPVFTAAAYAAGVIGTTTVTRGVRGEAAAVTFTLKRKIGEAVPSHAMGFTAAQFP